MSPVGFIEFIFVILFFLFVGFVVRSILHTMKRTQPGDKGRHEHEQQGEHKGRWGWERAKERGLEIARDWGYEAKIRLWEFEGFDVSELKKWRYAMKDRERIEQEFKEMERKIQRLKQAERELEALNAPQEVFSTQIYSIRSKLKLPGKVEEVEQELSALKARVAEYNREMAKPVPPPTPTVEVMPELPQYTILERIGSGGFSDIYRAQRKDGLVVALKMPRLAPFQTFVPTDFLKEAELWSKLNHPHIIKVYEYGAKPYPWIAMEYMEGGSLRGRIGKLSLEESADIGVKLTQALFYAHHLGVIHRDIKPENVLFDQENTPKLTDWGLGKVLLEASRSISGFKGTLAYSAPEQLSSSEFGETDWRTDIYQLGAMLYEMLTGELLFGGELGRILSEKPRAPSELNPGVPEELDRIILRSLAKRKEERYQDASAVREQLEMALRHIKER